MKKCYRGLFDPWGRPYLGFIGRPSAPPTTTIRPALAGEPMNRIISNLAYGLLFLVVLVALATARVARWCWAHRQQALDAIARAILATYAAGQQVRAWWDDHHAEVTSAVVLAGLVVLTTGQRIWSWGRRARRAVTRHQRMTCVLLRHQPLPAVAPITANLTAAWQLGWRLA
jgi:hypothetical protein